MGELETSDGTGRYTMSLAVAVDVKLDGNVFVATSPMVKGLVVVSKDRSKLIDLVESAMRDLSAEALSR